MMTSFGYGRVTIKEKMTALNMAGISQKAENITVFTS